MKNLKQKLAILITLTILLSGCVTDKKKINDENFNRLKKITSKLFAEEKITADSVTKIVEQFAYIKTDSAKKIFVDEFEKKASLSSVPKLSNEEYYKLFSDKFNLIKLDKLFGQAPLYGKYANNLANLMKEIDNANEIYNVLSDTQIKQLYEKIENKNKEALDNYLKYGEPDEDFIYINAACETALKQVLKNPDYEILKDKYYLKQTNTGYDYKLLINAKNSFGVNVKQEMTFNLKYNSFDKIYSVIDVK